MPANPFARTLALRYLRGARGRREGRGFLRFVTFAAIGGVAVGTAALLLSLTIVRGFSREIREKVVGFGQHVQVESYLGGPLTGADTLQSRLAAYPGVQRVTPAALAFVLVRARGAGADAQPNVDGVMLWATPPDGQPFVAEHVERGRFAFAPDEEGRPGLVVGARLAQTLAVGPGSIVTTFSTGGLERGGGFGARPTVRQFHVAGVFETGLADFDARFVFADLDVGRTFLGLDSNSVSRFDLVLDDINRSPAVAEAISAEIGPPVYARSVFDVFQNLFAWVDLQQSIIPVVISVLVLVAAFNIVGTLLMMILEKAREIGILLGMGASRASVRRLFLWLGLFVGATGSALGAGLALGLALLQQEFAIIPLPQEAYYLDAAPIELRALDFVWVTLAATALCTLAAWLPARTAARIEPIRSIRFAG